MADDITVQQFDAVEVEPTQHRPTLRLFFNTHHVVSAALLVYALDAPIGIAVGCYGLTIGLVVVVLRMTQRRNMRYSAL